MNKKSIPTGETFIEYDDFDYLTNGELVDINTNNIIYLDKIFEGFNPPDTSGWYTKQEIDNLLMNYSTIADVNELLLDYYTKEEIDTKLLNYYTINDVDTFLSDIYTKEEVDNLLLDYVDFETYTADIEEIQNHISNNTNSINTLNDIISANFETFGRYVINGQSLSDTDDAVRFNITEQIPLDSNYVNVSLMPNEFINLQAGKITFNIIADGLINNEVNDLTIELRIYKNEELLDSESKIIEAGKTVSVNFAGTFDVIENDIIYAVLEIVAGEGSLTTNNPVVIAIDFKSNNIQQAITSDKVINTYQDLPNNGINPEFVLNHQNQTNITNLTSRVSTNETDINDLTNRVSTNETNITNNTTTINKDKAETVLFINSSGAQANQTPITLNERIDNFREIIIIGYLDYDNYREKSIITSIPTSIINTSTGNDRDRRFIILVTGGGDQFDVRFNSLTQISTTWSSAERILKVIGKGRK